MPWRMSSATSSKLTLASLLSEREFIPSTLKPRFASSRVAIRLMKLAVRWTVRKAIVGAGPLSGV